MRFLALLHPSRLPSERLGFAVASELATATRQLLRLLRSQFSAVGNPPTHQQWHIKQKTPIVIDGILNEDAVRELCEIGLSKWIYFSAFLDEPLHPALADAAKNIPPVQAAIVAMREVERQLEVPGVSAGRVGLLFKQLQQQQWAETFSLAVHFEAGEVTGQTIGFGLCAPGREFLDDLTEAADEVDGIANPPPLTGKEEIVLEAIGNELLTGPQIADKAGYTCNSSFRTYLAGMVKRGLLVRVQGRAGYKAGKPKRHHRQ